MSEHRNIKRRALPVYVQFRWAARIAGSIGVLAALALAAEMFLITDGSGAKYAEVIVADSLTRDNLAPAIALFGLGMTILGSIIAWGVTLYGSHRIAGPLYRFSQNMRSLIEHPRNKPVPIRGGDLLQHEWQSFEASHAQLDQHYRHLAEALDDIRQTLAHDGEPDREAVLDAVARFEEAERLVQF